MRLIKDTILFTTREMPKWNPMNVCSYHLQEAGATPEQELAYALATAVAVLDTVKAAGGVEDFGDVVGRISILLNRLCLASSPKCARCARSANCGTRSPCERYGVTDPEAAAVPLRRAGQFAGPHRAAAGKQRLPHPVVDARRDDVEEGPRASRAIAGLERGARPAAILGPALVAAHAADPGHESTSLNMPTFSTARR